jgi:hypothetical protein
MDVVPEPEVAALAAKLHDLAGLAHGGDEEARGVRADVDDRDVHRR